jgi:hypothetical protein
MAADRAPAAGVPVAVAEPVALVAAAGPVAPDVDPACEVGASILADESPCAANAKLPARGVGGGRVAEERGGGTARGAGNGNRRDPVDGAS